MSEKIEVKVYAVKHKDFDVRMESRSGGIFTALSDWILDEDGVVYGCVLDEKFEAMHVRACSKEERNRMRGSKYIQSDLKDTFRNVQADLKEGKKVLFSGTSCQVAGLKAYLGTEYQTLICVDIVCHGVPSPLVWKEYLKWQERKYGKCTAVDFRNKKDFGWVAHVETLTMKMKNGNSKSVSSEVFKNLFYGHTILRPSCYKCPYKDIIHPGDITIADYWGIDKAAPGFSDNKGVSLVLINSSLGMECFLAVKSNIEYVATRIEDSMQPPLRAPFEEPKEREQFWKALNNCSFERVAKKYGGYGLRNRVKRMIKRILNKIKNMSKRIKGVRPRRV